MRNLFENLAVFACAAAMLTLTSQPAAGQASSAADPKGKPIRGAPIKRPEKTNGAAAAVVVESGTGIAKPSETKKVGDFLEVSFDKLANFTFEVPEGVVADDQTGKSNEQIPADVRALTKKKVALTGFMLPLKVDNGLVSEMLIMKDQSMCCYGAQPRINDWVSVKMSGKGVKSVMDQPVTLFGELRVGEMLENGYLIGIYEMTGEKMEVAEE